MSKDRLFSLSVSLGIWLLSCLFSFQFSNYLTESISNVVTKLTSTGSNVGESSSQLRSTSQSLQTTTAETAASLLESVGNVNQLKSMVKRTAENSIKVSQLSEETEKNTIEGVRKIKGLVEQMNKLSEESNIVKDIIAVIEDIAFQTNLLALNAAVEAARAGEQGKGFAVVAESVRSLALKSAGAAKEISALINSNVESIKVGTSQAKDCGSSLESISVSAQTVSILNKEVAEACHEQSIGLTRISEALSSLDLVTQTNAAASEAVASTSRALHSESQVMQSHLSQLQEIVHGDSTKQIGTNLIHI